MSHNASDAVAEVRATDADHPVEMEVIKSSDLEDIRKKIFEIQKDPNLGAKEKQQKIFLLFNKTKERTTLAFQNNQHTSASCSKNTVKSLLASIPVTNAEGKYVMNSNGTLVQIPCSQLHANEQTSQCVHYDRKCSIYAECCRKFFPCHRCHDQNNDHDLESKNVKVIRCNKCSQIQLESHKCTNKLCNIEFAQYYCGICKLWISGVDTYHCGKCNVCFRGKQENYRHCDTCGYDVACTHFSEHTCRKCDDEICAICNENFHKSPGDIEHTKCNHVFHMSCISDYIKQGEDVSCPVCRRTIFDMTECWEELDALKLLEVVPEDFQSWVIQYQCNDCLKVNCDKFSIYGYKCPDCNSYNTTQLVRLMGENGENGETHNHGNHDDDHVHDHSQTTRP